MFEIINPPDGKALVYIIISQSKRKSIKTELKINGQYLASTKGEEYIRLILEPNTYLIEAIHDNKSELKINIEADKKYYLSQEVIESIGTSVLDIKTIDEEDALEMLDKCKMIEAELSNDFMTYGEYQTELAMYAKLKGTGGEGGTDEKDDPVIGFIMCIVGAISSIFVGIFIFDIYPEMADISLVLTIYQYLSIFGAIITFIGVIIVLYDQNLGRIICLIGGIISGGNIITIVGAMKIEKEE